ncbi:ABC transporter permease [Caproiciproducens faecalis]|uniref:ABC transporter permease n=1 Tax=Caproiciproducens faecalis TaxID=2820301 RepID=A0ABS7DKX6_9FIRM|nr:ABC transporter permease [Caproiciproducens faecalis]MBW7571932.1 ABC transporter permease [Caproiciproducens faecalis]
MKTYILKRIAYLFVTLLVIMTATFFLMHSLPGTPFDEDKISKLSPEQQRQIYASYGLDQPVHVQYFKYLGNVFQGDFGTSTLYAGHPVRNILMSRIVPSAIVGIQAVLIGLAIGLLLGVVAAYRHNTSLDYLTMVISVLGISVPNFVVAALLQYLFGLKWGLLPVAYWESYSSSVLPSLALSFGVIAQIARFIRTEMLTVLQQDYILMAKSKGLSPVRILLRHALRNSMLPVLTILGAITVNVLTGSLAVESIYSVPGIGSLFVDTIKANDYSTIIGLTVFYSAFYVVVILIIDLLYCVIDPRIRLASAKE